MVAAMRSALFFVACFTTSAAKEKCGESKSPCSGKGTYGALISQLGGAGAQTTASKDLAISTFKDFTVEEIDAAKSWVTYIQGGKSGGCKLDAIKCGDKSKLSVKARRLRR